MCALIFDQLWPIHEWKCEEVDCILPHGDDLGYCTIIQQLPSFAPLDTYIFVNKRLHRPIFGIHVFYPNNGFPLASTHFRMANSSSDNYLFINFDIM